MAVQELDEESVFHSARQIASPDARERYLENVCGGDAPLRARVQALLHVHEQEQSFLAQPAQAPIESVDHGSPEGPGTLIDGKYMLLEQIGEGGFGVVFMAEQMQPVCRKVALKILKAGMDTRQVVARFEAERQALALMDHPNIARVLDGGVTPAGRPYFVMDLVKGVPITEFCDHDQLATKERLSIFLGVCEAVQHAHQKGIIHRDLKPSNVLVTARDGTPVVKVIDFGIAKAIGQELTDKTLFTGFAQMIGTPLYMSPEQAGLSEQDVDTRSDVYSLGVLLYELLTGTTPFDKARLTEANFDEVRRIIREEDPPKPSTRISTLGQAATTVSTQRKSDPQRLRLLYRGELDWIVMKALEKDRDRRYETASAFALDLQRYLADEPVLACPPSAGYRLGKFVRRNKVAFLATTIVSTVLVVATIVSVWQAARATESSQAERKAREELDVALTDAKESAKRAQAQRQRARQAVDDMYTGVAEQWLTTRAGLEPMQRDFLSKALAYYQDYARDQGADSETRRAIAQAQFKVGEIQFALGEQRLALAAFDRAVDLFQQLADESPSETEHRDRLGCCLVRRGEIHQRERRGAEAEQELRRAAAVFEQICIEMPRQRLPRGRLAAARLSLGQVLTDAGRYQEAEKALRENIAILNELVAQAPPSARGYRSNLVLSHHHLAVMLRKAGRLDQAEHEMRVAIAICAQLAEEMPGAVQPQYLMAQCHLTLGGALLAMDRTEQAEQAYRQALVASEWLMKVAPLVSGHRVTLATSRFNLGLALLSKGRVKEAETLFRQNLEMDPNSAMAQIGVAWLRASSPRTSPADAKEAVGLAKKAVSHSPKDGGYWRTLGIAYYRAGEWNEAIMALEEARELGKGGNSFEWFFLAMAHWRLGDTDQAGKWYDQAVRWMEKNRPKNEELLRFRAEAEQLLGINK